MFNQKRILVIILFSILTISLIPKENSFNDKRDFDLSDADDTFYEQSTDYSKQLINDSTIDEPLVSTPWNQSVESQSVDDIETDIANQQLNYKLVGDTQTFSINDSPVNSSVDTNWISKENPDFPAFPEWPDNGDHRYHSDQFTDSYGIDEYGVWANHSWYESAKQTPSVNWVDNFSVTEDMSEYE